MLAKSTKDLCFDCHMDQSFMDRERHGPFKIGMCSKCHDAHQSENRKLLIGSVPDLCFTCHNPEAFKRARIHKPVAEGKCFECHGVHTAPSKGLIKSDPSEVCRKCHKNTFRQPHPLTQRPGSGSGGASKAHPISGVENPRRLGTEMSCVSCHNPHSSDWGSLFRYKTEKPQDLCAYCHR
jgi:predicted CXXCH cytochrome family protein